MDDSNTGTIGILEEYIPHTSTLGRPYGGIEAVTHEQKRGWAEQVSHNVRLLHKIGVGGVMRSRRMSLSIVTWTIAGWLISGVVGQMGGLMLD